jgi:hypothetical protein
MNKLFKKIIALALIQLALITVFMVKPNPYMSEKKTCYTKTDTALQSKPKILFFGDSHVDNMFKFSPVEGVGNLSMYGDSYLDIYYKLSYSLNKNKNIKYVLIACDLHSCSEYKKMANHEKTNIKLCDYKSYKRLDRYSFSSYLLAKLYNHLPLLTKKFYAHDIETYLIKTKRWIAIRFFGAKHKNNLDKKNWAQLTPEDRIKKTRDRFKYLEIGSIDDVMIDNLRETVELCHDKGVKVIGLMFPVSAEFNSLVNKEFADTLTKKYKELGMDSFYDYRHIFENNPDFFTDQDHLSRQGKNKFWDIIKEIVPLDFKVTKTN